MPAGESVDSNLAFTPGKKSFKKLLTEQKNVRKKWDYYQLPADVFYYGSDSGYPSGKLLL